MCIYAPRTSEMSILLRRTTWKPRKNGNTPSRPSLLAETGQVHGLSVAMVTMAPFQRQLFGTVSLEFASWQSPGMLKHTTHSGKKTMVSSLDAQLYCLLSKNTIMP